MSATPLRRQAGESAVPVQWVDGKRWLWMTSPALPAIGAASVLAVMAGDNVVRLLPPLVTTPEEAREGLARLEKAAEKLHAAKLR